MTGASAAFLRFSRDKRGYEHFYLVQPTTNRRGKTRSRILYWFRTPPGVKVGRLPFDDDVRRALESQNPGVAFDWKKLLSTPIPPPAPDVERWRERRRVERAEKAARRALAAPDEEETPETDHDDGHPATIDAVSIAGEAEHESEPEPADDIEAVEEPSDVADTGAAQAAAAQPPATSAQPGRKRRRRRRGGRRNQGPANSTPPSSNGGE